MSEEAQSTQTEDFSIEALFDKAEAEVASLATDTVADPDSPAGEAEAVGDDEQSDPEAEVVADPEQAESDEFEFEDIGDTDDDGDDSDTPTIDLSTKIEVKGHGEVPIEELRDGYMRQADYTRGKQALAAERETFAQEQEQAAKILATLQDDPVGVAAYLAVETGLLTEDQVDKIKMADLRKAVTVPKADEIQTMIDAKVEEALASHPEVQEAKAAKVRAAIDAEFNQISEEVGKPLSEKAKIRIIEYANEHDLIDLKVAFNALSSEQARKAKAREAVKNASGERPKTRGGDTSAPKTKVDSLEEALALAEAEHGAS